MIPHEFQVPDEHELIEFFGSEASERAVDDGYWCYEVAGALGTRLRFSLNLYERSVQTELRIRAAPIATVSHEMATRLRVEGGELRCEFVCTECRTTLTVNAAQGYKPIWSTLRTK
jgi:hypothetical protein